MLHPGEGRLYKELFSRAPKFWQCAFSQMNPKGTSFGCGWNFFLLQSFFNGFYACHDFFLRTMYKTLEKWGNWKFTCLFFCEIFGVFFLKKFVVFFLVLKSVKCFSQSRDLGRIHNCLLFALFFTFPLTWSNKPLENFFTFCWVDMELQKLVQRTRGRRRIRPCMRSSEINFFALICGFTII